MQVVTGGHAVAPDPGDMLSTLHLVPRLDPDLVFIAVGIPGVQRCSVLVPVINDDDPPVTHTGAAFHHHAGGGCVNRGIQAPADIDPRMHPITSGHRMVSISEGGCEPLAGRGPLEGASLVGEG